MYLRPSPSDLIRQDQTKEARERFEHVVIDLKSQLSKSGDAALVAATVLQEDQKVPQQERRRSSLQWITGKVEQLKKRFTPIEAEKPPLSIKSPPVIKPSPAKQTPTKNHHQHQQQQILSPSDALFLKICKKYKKCAENKYCALDFAFDDLITQFSALFENIEMVESTDELPRAALLFPLSDATGLSILDFEQVGGYSLGRGSKIVQRGQENISRSHCLLFLNRDGLAVKDCDSHTGTFVCGRLIGSGVAVPLENFDIIQMGYSQRGPQDNVQFLVVFLRNWNGRKFGEQMQSVASPISLVQSPTLSRSALDLGERVLEREPTFKIFTQSPVAVEERPVKTNIEERLVKTNIEERPVIAYAEEHPLPFFANEQPKTYVEERSVKQSYSRSYVEEREPPGIQSFVAPPQPQSNIRERRPFDSVTTSANPSPLTQEPSARSHHNSPVEKSIAIPASAPATVQSSTPVQAAQTLSPWSIATQAEFFEPSKVSTPLSTTSSPTLTEIGTKNSSKEQSEEVIPAPPMRPKTRIVKKNLTKSIEEFNAPVPAAAQFTVKSPIEVPEILRAAHVSEIPAISPITEWLLSAPMQAKRSHSLSIALMEKRPARLQKMRKLAEFSTLPIGASTVRYENFLDFGLFSSDISDGAARTWRGSSKESMKWAFHNYRGVWEVEGIDLGSGTKFLFSAQDQNRYSVSVAGGSSEEAVQIGQFGMDAKRRMMAKMVFNLTSDSAFNKLSGKETSNTLQALRQLSFFYPHLKTPALLIKGAPIGPESSVHLSLEGPEAGESKSVGRVKFENHRITWTKHSMTWATDLDSGVLEAESLLADLLHGAVLLYCLRYHLD